MNFQEPIRIPTAEPNEEERDAFLVTRDFHLLGKTVKPTTANNQNTTAVTGEGVAKKPGGGWVGQGHKENLIHSPPGGEENHRNLHEMNV